LRFDDQTVGLCIADVSGKGLPAALMMANLQATVKAYASKHTNPRALCERVNQAMCGNFVDGKYITFFYALFSAGDKSLVYSNAGHNPPILSGRDNSIVYLDRGGTVIGLFNDRHYEEGRVTLASGDRLLLYTDGITEARNMDGQEFGDDRLVNLMTQPEGPGHALTENVIEAATTFSRGNFEDDLTVLALSIN
jgi:sigma-B regulation protein RsbU (phosphoserine phosphatase)